MVRRISVTWRSQHFPKMVTAGVPASSRLRTPASSSARESLRRVAPNAVCGLTNLIMTHDSPHGRIVVDWTKEEKRFILTLTVPKGTTAEIILPGGESSRAGEGVQFFEVEMD